jgi:fucose permease
MTAGIPGSGIGGLFYLLCAFLMPAHELVSLCTGKSSPMSRRMVLRQVLNACGVFCGVWLTGWFITHSAQAVARSLHIALPSVPPAFRLLNFVFGLITLLSVIVAVQVGGFFLRKTRAPKDRGTL